MSWRSFWLINLRVACRAGLEFGELDERGIYRCMNGGVMNVVI